MKIAATIAKILAAVATIAGAVYLIATYGDKIVAWAKKVLGCTCCCDEECCCEDGECCCAEGEECCCDEECCCECEEAPAEVQEQVSSLINGRYWEAYVNPTSYRVEFTEPNNFVVKTSFGSNGGTYSVRNGYIFCTYSTNNATIKIPYEIMEQGVSMDLGETFRSN